MIWSADEYETICEEGVCDWLRKRCDEEMYEEVVTALCREGGLRQRLYDLACKEIADTEAAYRAAEIDAAADQGR